MRFDTLRHAFAAIVTLAAPAGCCGDANNPTELVEHIDTTLPSLSAEVEACRRDDLACEALCEKIIGPSSSSDVYLVIDGCFMDETGPMTADLTMSYYYVEECVGGRRPPGLAGHRAASWLAECARLEAASVPAFLRTARELEAAGAPAALIAAARRSAADEVRHARAMGTLARLRSVRAQVTPSPLRSLADLAIENAVEGCAREPYGALIATHQARCARDPSVRAALAPIARDETRHAAFSFALDRWARGRLGPVDRRRLTDARRAAVADLLPTQPDAALGLPGPALLRHARALLG